jgi:hypothetical protein
MTIQGFAMVVLLVLPLTLLGVMVARGSKSDKATSGCVSIFVLSGLVLIPQAIGFGIGLAVTGQNDLGASLIAAIVGGGAAIVVAWFITNG